MYTSKNQILSCILWTTLLFIIFGWNALYNRGVIGFDGAEIWAFVWGHHWAHEALNSGLWPYETDLLDHPTGGVLWLKDPIMLLLMHPVRLIFGIPIAILFSQYLLFLLASLSTFLLARHHRFTIRTSTICALSYAFSPHALGEAYNGNLEAIAHGWLPLWMLCWLILIESPTKKNVTYAGMALFALLLSNQYWAIAMIFAGLGTLPLLKRHTWWDRGIIFCSIGCGGLLFVPIAFVIWNSLHAPIRLNDVTSGSIPLQPPYLSDIKEFFLPMSQSEHITPFQDLIYVGYLLFIGSVFSLFHKGKTYLQWLYPILGIWFIILSLGPALYWDGALILSPFDNIIHLPWYHLFQNVEVLNWMTLPHRMAIPASLFLTLSVGFWLSHGFKKEWLGMILLCELWLFPSYEIPLKSTPLHDVAHAQLIKELPSGAVLNLPINLYSNTQRKHLWYQTQHKHPISDHFRYSMLPRIAEKTRFLEYSRAITKAPLPSTEDPDPLQINILYSEGYRYVVLHKEFITEQLNMTPSEYARWMNLHLGEGIILEDSFVYPLDKSLLGTTIPSYKSTFSLGLP